MRCVPTALAFTLSTYLPAAAMVGGASPAADGLGRWIVMVLGSRGNLCTGTALTRDLVLTAAHCVAAAPNHRILSEKGAALMEVHTASTHPRFDPQSFANNRATADVALIKLAAPL